MTKSCPQVDRTTTTISHYSKKYQKRTNISPSMVSCYYPKLFLFIIAICVTLLILFQIQSLHIPPSPSPPSWPSFIPQFHKLTTNCTQDLHSISQRLRDSVTFLPLKDQRYSDKALQGHTWFMSSMYDSHEEGEVQFLQFPSKSSLGRLLCLKGRDEHDGPWNYYALARPETLPVNATLMKGLIFVSYNHYNCDNIWHGLSAMVPFVAWHRRYGCETPNRWILYHWGELRLGMGLWLRTLMGTLSLKGSKGSMRMRRYASKRRS